MMTRHSWIRARTSCASPGHPRLPSAARVVAVITAAAWLLGPQGVAIVPQAAPPVSVVRLPGHVLAALAEATPRSSSGEEADEILLTIVLRRSDEAGFKEYLREVYEPARLAQPPPFPDERAAHRAVRSLARGLRGAAGLPRRIRLRVGRRLRQPG